MDLLGSILGTMTGPPKGSEKEREEKRKAKELNKKIEEKRSAQAKIFRQKIEAKVEAFVKTSVVLDRDKPTEDGSIRDNDKEYSNRCIQLEPMTQYERSVVHDVAEVAGLIAHSFGQEDIDRHVVLWKQEYPPSEDEINTLKQVSSLLTFAPPFRPFSKCLFCLPLEYNKYDYFLGKNMGSYS